MAAEELEDGGVILGAQNVHEAAQGAFTGEVSASMLAEMNVTYVIVGHSERRQIFGESDSLIADKFVSVQASSMVPILCLGESLQQRNNGETKATVLGQLDAVLGKVGISAFSNAVIAYEPIWAIGTGQTATPEQAQEVHAAIRRHLVAKDAYVGANIRLLYGGSVNAANANELFAQQDIDGGLVGGASLRSAEFTSICVSAG
jgi:triosephosphate isomerase